MNLQSNVTPHVKLAGTDRITQLADVLCYGLVGLADPKAHKGPAPDSATWWVADTRKSAPHFHVVSPRLRAVTLALHAPVADRRLLGAAIALSASDCAAQQSIVFLPPPDAVEDCDSFLTRGAGQAVAHRALMLREHRRQQLGLSAALDGAAIDAAIYEAYVLPVAQLALEHLMPAGAVVRLSSTPPPDHVDIRHFVPLAPLADDPLSANVFALAMRIGFHGDAAPAVKPWLRLSPFEFGLKVRRAATPSEIMHRIALSAPQLCLLSQCTPTGDQNAGSK